MSKVGRLFRLMAATMLLSTSAAHAQVFSNVFTFVGTNGAAPSGPLILTNGLLYGTTAQGGTNGNGGLVFSVSTNGSNFTVVHDFAAASGETPGGSLLLLDGMFYGSTSTGGTGANTNGALFALNTTGTVFTVLTNFDEATGTIPQGGLISDGTTLFGDTSDGGTNGGGTIFSIGTNGANLQVLHAFPTSSNDGANPEGSLLLISNVLYGTTAMGGTNDNGTIFSIETNGTNFVTMYFFTGGTNSGATPMGALTDVGPTLFGVTASGGSNNDGVVFSIGTNGSNFLVLHDFAGTNGGGAPVGDLIVSHGTLFGLTSAGGISNQGTAYSISTNGANFLVLTNFVGANGGVPLGSFVAGSNIFYATTSAGGTTNLGTIFSFTPSAAQSGVVCLLTPTPVTNTVGSLQHVVASVTSNGTPVEGTVVNFLISAGPNAGTNATATTDAGGLGTFTYSGIGGTGTDTILATGTVASTIFTGTTAVVWLSSNSPPPALTVELTELEESCKSSTKIDELTDSTNDVESCTVKLVFAVSNSSISKATTLPVLVWTGQGSIFNPSLNPPTKPTKLKVGTTSKPAKVNLSLKLTGDTTDTFIYITETNDTVITSIELP
ncbi:MAG TPA: choice-of-anchor tandem repeat GloVer-containing protein [Verrucomicrobiae bacterium]|nr:choice-of-anchor tandem repeat GloVer-containing protein [Verrucomicrobiae bacterium]